MIYKAFEILFPTVKKRFELKFTTNCTNKTHWERQTKEVTILNDVSPLFVLACARLSVSADERNKQASSDNASERQTAGRERREETVSVFSNTTVRQLPHQLPEKPSLVSK